MVFGVITDNSVSAYKQVCRCDPEHMEAAKACESKGFYCYTWGFHYYCEVTDTQKPRFEQCCKDYSIGKDPAYKFKGIWCRSIND